MLAFSGFVMIMTETLPAGLLPQISQGLGVGTSTAGQLVSVYAAGTVLASVPAIAATRRRSRKPLLLLGIAGFILVNAATALSSNIPATLAFRFVAGCLSGLVWGLIPGYAQRIVPPALTGRGLAVAMVGTPVALAFGTPLGTFAGTLLGWRWAFAGLAVASSALLLWALVLMPAALGQSAATQTPARNVLAKAGIPSVLAIVVTWMLAHNILYTYIAPYLAATNTGAGVDAVLLVFGIAALAGIWITGVLVDRMRRGLLILSLVTFALAATALALAGSVPAVLIAAVVSWGLSFGGASTLLNTAATAAAADDRDVAAAWVSTTWNLAILGGSAGGGLLLAYTGARAFPLTLLPLILAALVVAVAPRRPSRPRGSRLRLWPAS